MPTQDTKQAAIERVNVLTEERFRLELERDTIKKEYETAEAELKERFAPRLEAVEVSINQLDAEIFGYVRSNRGTLIAKGKQSFTTIIAVFQFRKPSQAIKVQDGEGVMAVARKIGVVRKIADPIRSYKLNRKKFIAWLKKHPEHYEAFDEYLEVSDKESLTIKPNSTYMVTHDSQRISPPSVTVKDGASEEPPDTGR